MLISGNLNLYQEYFSNNSIKETVLIPWRVVNMHMGDTIGGYSFYAEGYEDNDILPEPRLIENGEVTADIFLNENTKVLEMNSKSGLYPLYLANSFYCMALSKPEKDLPLEDTQKIWREVLEKNIFVLCMTPMARQITIRTLAGFNEDWQVNAIYLTKLLERMKDDQPRLARKLSNPNTWGKEDEKMKFDAVVGNPPYQLETGSTSRQAVPIYPYFVEQAKELQSQYISMIMPSRWFAGGMGLDKFRNDMMTDKHISKIQDYVNSKDCFPQISISGGVCFFLWDKKHNGNCNFTSVYQNQKQTLNRPLDEFNVLVRYNEAVNIIHKVIGNDFAPIIDIISPLMPFGLPTNFRGEETKSEDNNIALHSSTGITYISRNQLSKGFELIDSYKVLMSKTGAEHAGEPGKDGSFKVFTSSMKVIGPDEVCTHSYFIIGNCCNPEEANNIISYLKTKFVRFLVLLSLSAINLSKLVFTFVPMQDFSKPWTDEELYAKYGLDDEEVAFIESMIKPME